jgi:hypothetical protein
VLTACRQSPCLFATCANPMTDIFSSKTLKLLLPAIFIGLFTQSSGQNPYSIDITNQNYAVRDNFLKTGSNQSPLGEILSYNSLYLTKNGQPWYPVMGEMHFSRVAESDWENSILKMKSNGLQIISSYIFWNHHEEQQGIFDWKENKNLRKFLQLCKKHEMYVWLRPGPWVHAEARYGGFPNWLINKKIELRSNNQTYLSFCDTFFKAIGEQTRGLYFKDGGPIIGVQIENEYAFKTEAKYQHMKNLKSMLVSSGFDVPYYSAFAAGPDNQDEFFFMLGAYPDSPWAQHTKKMYKPMFFIRPLEGDSDIGSDLFGKVDSKVKTTYPKLSAELGSGMQVTYHRRVTVDAKDVAATAFVKIASGLNGLGYYMFHGGINPVGQTTLQESRETNYPNDVPIINYDFQSPVGAMGILAPSYGEYRLLHLFLNDFGSALASKKAFFPQQMVKSYFHHDTVQVALRVHQNSGFIFLSNYQRFVDLKGVDKLQLQITNGASNKKIPLEPVKFAANSFAIWPYNLKINNANLYYATAQPLCVLKNANLKTFVFFADGQAEFVFDKEHVKKIKTNLGTRQVSDGKYYKVFIDCNQDFFDIVDKGNQTTRIMVLSRAKALMASKIKVDTNEFLLMSNANLTNNSSTITLEDISEKGVVNIEVYPSISLNALAASFAVKPVNSQTIFQMYELKPNEPAYAETEFTSKHLSYSIKEAILRQDSVLKSYAQGRYFKASQPGPTYQYTFSNLPEQNVYALKFKVNENPNVKNWLLKLNYTADVIALYKNGKLAYDQFNYNNYLNYKLDWADLQPNADWTLQLLPIKNSYEIYVEDHVKQSKTDEFTKAIILNAKILPIWRYHLTLKPIK